MRVCRRRRVSCLGSAAFIAAAVLVPASPAAAAPDAIGVCCAWGDGIKDGITYSINAPASLVPTMAAEVEAWEAETGISLNPAGASASKKDTEVVISYKRGGGVVAGQTIRKFEPRSAFLAGANIKISGGAFGLSYDTATIALITLHEFGHVLGADHADAAGYVMSPTVESMNDTITTCDENAVRAAQDWWFDNHDGTPTNPSVTSVSC